MKRENIFTYQIGGVLLEDFRATQTFNRAVLKFLAPPLIGLSVNGKCRASDFVSAQIVDFMGLPLTWAFSW